MAMNESNVQCLLNCAEIILQCDIKTFSALKDVSLFYKIINEPIVKPDIDSLLKKLTDIFNTDIQNIIDIENYDNLSDFEIAKVLLLCVVVYILFIDYTDKSNALVNLCDNIPINLHQNACTMFGPFIMKHSDKIELTKEDLDNALLVNDKENQTTYFSPIREKQRPHLMNEKIITEQKRKIHKDIKAFQAFDPFPANTNSPSSSSNSENRSPLVKLLELVQSPKFHGKSLVKANRELERRVRQLEHQLDASVAMEKELQRSVGEEKQRCKRLEKELRDEQSVVHSKDDLIGEKDHEIERLHHLSVQNRRLDEKMRDYQDKASEIQLLSGQLAEKCQENKMLKIENRELGHFKALAIDRRLKIEHLTTEVNNHKDNFQQLQATRIRLSETESQLVELQNHMHSLQRNNASNNDSLSEMSLNSSLIHSECAPHIIEMERDELRSELWSLKQETIPRTMIEETQRQLVTISSDLARLKTRLDDSEGDEDASATAASPDCPIDHIKQVIHEMDHTVVLHRDKTAQLVATNSDLLARLDRQLTIENELRLTIELMNADIEQKNRCFHGIGDVLFRGREYDMDDVLPAVLANDRCLGQLRNNVQTLRDTVSDFRQLADSKLTFFVKEIAVFKQSLSDPSAVISDSSPPFFRALLDFHRSFITTSVEVASLKDEVEALKGQNRVLESDLGRVNIAKNELVSKHDKDALEMRTDMLRLVEEYQECLTSLENATSDFEDKMSMKDDEMRLDKLRLVQLEEEMILLTTEIGSVTSQRNSLLEEMQLKDQEVFSLRDNLERELLLRDDTISELRQMIAKEIGNSQMARTQLELITTECEKKLQKYEESSGTELARLNSDISELETRLLSKDREVQSLMQSQCDELSRLSLEIDRNIGHISNLQCQIEAKNRDLVTKDEQLSELQKVQMSIENMYRITLDELDSQKAIRQQHDELKCKFDDVVQQSARSSNAKDQELHFKKSELVKSHNEINKLRSELSANAEKFEQHSILMGKYRQDSEEQQLRNQQESVKKAEEITLLNLQLDEKDLMLDDHKGKLALLEKELEELRGKHEDSLMECEYLAVIDQKYVELTKDHQELERRFEKCHKELEDAIRLRAEDTGNLRCEIEHLEEREKQLEAERRENLSTVSRLHGEITDLQANLKVSADKCLRIQAEGALELQSRLSKNMAKYSDALATKTNTIEKLQNAISTLEAENESMNICSSEYLDKISVLENIISTKTDELKSLTDTIDDGLLKIDELCIVLKGRHDSGDDTDIGTISNACEMRNDQVEWKRSQFVKGISQLDTLLAQCHRLHLANEANMDGKIRALADEIDCLQKTILDHKTSLELLNDQISSLTKEKEVKIQQLSTANVSLVEFNTKILNLESIIEGEMANYEKVSEEYRNVEQESNQFKEKYNKLLRKNQEDISNYEVTIAELSSQILKIEEERDDQIHEMEKLFNAEIFELQQNLEDRSSELDSIKKEIIETRKVSKSTRATLELEKERLQKALVTRQNQFAEEKAQLIINLDKEREEKLKYKEFNEDKIQQLENDRKIAEEKFSVDLNETKAQLDKSNEQLKQSQLEKFRAVEMLKKTEMEFKNEKTILQTRIKELEPLEKQIENLESTTHRLMSKLTELESNDNWIELKHLRGEMKNSLNNIRSLEKEKEELIARQITWENKVKNFLKDKNSLEQRNSYLQEKVQSLEYLDKTKLDKIENLESEIESLKSENESLKGRYLKLQEISDTHLKKVMRIHEETENNYIEQNGSLTKDKANLQDQIEILTVKKNMLTDDNCALKRSVAELTSKLNSLKDVLREHTENEMRQLRENYNESSRYTRMSSWGMRPQLNRQLPPVDRIDKDSLLALGLNSKSKLKFESFIYSPYICEDEPSISFHKQLPSDTNRADQNIRKPDHPDSVSQIATPLKKKKDGIRQQITTKIRRSLHLESAGETKTDSKRLSEAVAQTPLGSVKKDQIQSTVKGNNKPPMAPRKNISAKLRSSQVSVIDLDEYRHRHDRKRISKAHEKKDRDDNQESIYSVTSTTASNLVPSTSACSLFDQTDQDPVSSPTRECAQPEILSLDSPFTQRPKTPKPNSIIRRLIRKSKIRTPKRKHGSIGKLTP